MTMGPSWLADLLAVAAARLVLSRAPGLMSGRDADLVHIAMGVAMAGMFAPSLTVLRPGPGRLLAKRSAAVQQLHGMDDYPAACGEAGHRPRPPGYPRPHRGRRTRREIAVPLSSEERH